MKKLTIILSVLAMFGFACAQTPPDPDSSTTYPQFKNGLTDEVPNARSNAMGGIYSLIETSNYADFPQRILTGQEGAWIGTKIQEDYSGGWGLVRYKLNNFLSLPNPMAWQISAEQISGVSIQDLFDYVGLEEEASDPYNFGEFGLAESTTNRINSSFAFGLNEKLLLGLGLKMYSNGNSSSSDNEEYESSFWGLETTSGATMMLGADDFIDASIDLDFWSWKGTHEINNVDAYEFNYTECDGIMNFGLNARYYNTGTKVDYSPYMKFNYFSFSAVEGQEDVDPVTPLDQNGEFTYEGSLFNFTLGSGVHYKPAEGVKVYNEFEFRYQSCTSLKDQTVGETEETQTVMTLLPTYRMGVELTKSLNPEDWWFNSIQLWGGFNKTFADLSTTNDTPADNVEATKPTYEDISITSGFAMQNGNFKIEFSADINNSLFSGEMEKTNAILGLVYMFNK